MKTKPFFILVLILTASLLLSACGAGAAQVNQPVADEQPASAPATSAPAQPEPTAEPENPDGTLTIYTNWDYDADSKGAVLKQIVEEFTAAYPNIELSVEFVPDYDMATKVETSFLANQEPDIIMHNWMGPSKEWLSDGVVVPVNEYLVEWGLDGKFKPNALNDYKVGDEYAAFPIEGFNWPMWYNMEILEAAGVDQLPTTFAELTDVAIKVREAGYQPFAIGGKDWTGGDWFLTAATAAIGNEQAAELFVNGGFSDNDSARQFVEEFVQMRDAGVFIDNVEGMEFETMNAAFFDGKAAMMHGGSWSYADLPSEMAQKVKLGGIPLPANALGATKPFWYSSFEAKGFWITRNGKENLEPVKLFAQMFFDEKNIARFVEQSAMIPPFNEVEIDESILPPLFVQSLSLDVDTVKHATTAFAPASVYDAWYTVTANAFVPGFTADEILLAMDDLYK